MLSFTGWVAVSGFVFAHWLDALFYYPRDVLEDPLLLLRLWEGLSSFGGFAGAFVGAFAWRFHYKATLLPYADIVASSFPVSMAFGRLGCAVAHDHPGLRSDFFLAVRFPDGGRHDLGFYEFLLMTPLAITFLDSAAKAQALGLLRRHPVHVLRAGSLSARFLARAVRGVRAGCRRDGGRALPRADARAVGVPAALRARRDSARALIEPGTRAARRAAPPFPEASRPVQTWMARAPRATRATSGSRPGVSPSMSIRTSAFGTSGSASTTAPRVLVTPGSSHVGSAVDGTRERGRRELVHVRHRDHVERAVGGIGLGCDEHPAAEVTAVRDRNVHDGCLDEDLRHRRAHAPARSGRRRAHATRPT